MELGLGLTRRRVALAAILVGLALGASEYSRLRADDYQHGHRRALSRNSTAPACAIADLELTGLRGLHNPFPELRLASPVAFFCGPALRPVRRRISCASASCGGSERACDPLFRRCLTTANRGHPTPRRH
jgi:hypothetical protein